MLHHLLALGIAHLCTNLTMIVMFTSCTENCSVWLSKHPEGERPLQLASLKHGVATIRLRNSMLL